jgi:multidrug efflux pump subunit AcrA (membrane-fusion protein)
MKAFFNLIFSAVFLLCISGCTHGPKESEASAAVEKEGVQFNPKRGLQIPERTAKFIGLTIVDVEDREIGETLSFSGQVYEADRGILASSSFSKGTAEKLKPGQGVTVEKDGMAVKASIQSIGRISDNQPVEVILRIDGDKEKFPVGSFVSGKIETKNQESVTSIPRSALLKAAEGTFVYTVSGEHFVRTAVKVGGTNDEFVEIRDGLLSGDQIVSKPVTTLWLAELQSIRGGKACADGD